MLLKLRSMVLQIFKSFIFNYKRPIVCWQVSPVGGDLEGAL